MLDRAYSTNSLLELGLQASIIKNDVSQNNIANADTPNYKRQVVNFDEQLKTEVEKARTTGNFNKMNTVPTIVTDPTSYRLDGNSVDINTEMVALYQNSIKYDMLANSVTNNLKRLNVALGK